MISTIFSKDLSKEAPRSPRNRVGGYPLLARMVDKGRAALNGTAGEYHFACPLDQMLFEFKGVTAEQVNRILESGADDQQVVDWFNQNGTPKSPEEIKAWADQLEQARPYETPEKRDWFVSQCEPLGLDPAKTTLFEYLEADDAASFRR
jgi:hypothetical protein